MTAPDELREALRAKTSQIISIAHRQNRRSPWGPVVMAYAAGVLTIVITNHFAQPMRPAVDAPVIARSPTKIEIATVPSLAPPRTSSGRPLPLALQLELAAAAASPENAHELFKQAGDEYLATGDERNAARCYANYLTKSKTLHSTREPDDTWLLAVLKLDRKQSRQTQSVETCN